MTGLLLFFLLLAAISLGLERHHRDLRRTGRTITDPEMRRELRALPH